MFLPSAFTASWRVVAFTFSIRHTSKYNQGSVEKVNGQAKIASNTVRQNMVARYSHLSCCTEVKTYLIPADSSHRTILNLVMHRLSLSMQCRIVTLLADTSPKDN